MQIVQGRTVIIAVTNSRPYTTNVPAVTTMGNGTNMRNVFQLIVDVDFVDMFKAQLDEFWMHQQVKFDFRTDFTGIGDRSFVERESN